MNKVVITNDKRSRYNFSFFDKKAIHEIRSELKIIRRTDTTKTVVDIKETLSSCKKLTDRLAIMKKTNIVLK